MRTWAALLPRLFLLLINCLLGAAILLLMSACTREASREHLQRQTSAGSEPDSETAAVFERHPIQARIRSSSSPPPSAPSSYAVTIRDAAIRPNPIFYSLYPYYQENDFFDVVLSNPSSEPIQATVGLFIPGIMSRAHQETVVLPPQSTEKYTFKVTFDPALFNRPEAYFDRFVSPEIHVNYASGGREFLTTRQLERVFVAGKGKLSWNVQGMIAAFITPEDLAVESLARGLVQRYDRLLTDKFSHSNIGRAALLFNALSVYKIRYQADQKTPFSAIVDDPTIFDTVQYPAELLAKPEGVDTKIGDCDDLTVLYASLLESLGIDTVLLQATEPGRGHFFLMFDSGVSSDRVEDHFVSPAEFVAWEGRIWIPLETTMFGFIAIAEAWRVGVGEYKRLKPQGQIDELYVRQWMQTYEPAVLLSYQTELPEQAAMDSILQRDLKYFEWRVDQYVLQAVTSLDTPDGAYDAGAAYLRINHLERALALFDRVLAMNSQHAHALNSKGVVLTRQSRYNEAVQLYHKALIQMDHPGFRTNMALAYYLKGDRRTAGQLYHQAIARGDLLAERFDFLATVGDAQESYDAGVSHLRHNQLEEALEQFGVAQEKDPLFAAAVNAKAMALARLGQLKKALPVFEQAVRMRPDQPSIRFNTALAHYLTGDLDRTRTLLLQLVEQDSSYEGIFDFPFSYSDDSFAKDNKDIYRIAVAHMQQREFDEALEWLDRALDTDPKMGDAYNARGLILTNLGRYDEAYAMFERAEELMPTNPGVRLNMAIVRYLQGRRHEASVIYRQVIKMDSSYEGFLDFLEPYQQ